MRTSLVKTLKHVAASADRGGFLRVPGLRLPGSATPATASNSRASLGVARVEPLQRETCHLARVFQIEFVFDVRSVGLHCFRTEM